MKIGLRWPRIINFFIWTENFIFSRQLVGQAHPYYLSLGGSTGVLESGPMFARYTRLIVAGRVDAGIFPGQSNFTFVPTCGQSDAGIFPWLRALKSRPLP